jgi:signal transduction histidine kinase
VETAEGVVFQVRDNGRGIAEEDMELAYVRALLQRLDGKIECQSRSGAGSTLSFTLPRVR